MGLMIFDDGELMIQADQVAAIAKKDMEKSFDIWLCGNSTKFTLNFPDRAVRDSTYEKVKAQIAG